MCGGALNWPQYVNSIRRSASVFRCGLQMWPFSDTSPGTSLSTRRPCPSNSHTETALGTTRHTGYILHPITSMRDISTQTRGRIYSTYNKGCLHHRPHGVLPHARSPSSTTSPRYIASTSDDRKPLRTQDSRAHSLRWPTFPQNST